MSDMLADRVDRAAELWKAGKVVRILVSGDHHRWAYGSNGVRSEVREIASRVKAVGNATLNTGVLLGPPVPITGEANESWGAAPPPGTPPAGAPRPLVK